MFASTTATSTNDPPNRRSSLPTHSSVESSPAAAAAANKSRECRIFEPQQWRRSVCKNCFRTEPEHNASLETPPESTTTTTTTTTHAVLNPPPWPVTPAIPRKTVANMEPPAAILGQGRTPIGGVGGVMQSRCRPGLRATEESQRGLPGGHRGTPVPMQTPPAQAMPPPPPPPPDRTGLFSSASSIDARYVEELENDFFDLEDKYDTLARERNELSMDLELKMRNVEELQTSLEQYKEKVVVLERRCVHLEEEIKTYRERLRLPESDQAGGGGGVGTDAKGILEVSMEGSEAEGDLRTRLNQVEQLCQDVMEENEVLKEEIEEMQREIEEMHDHFHEEDRDSMREMQRDLEAANKTCRILQFKLRKAERRFEQVESERANLEERLTHLESATYSDTDVAHIRGLEEDLRIAKEVVTRLNNELDVLEDRRNFYEGENHQLKDELQICQNRRITSENEVDRLRLELEKLKYESRFAERGPLQVTDKKGRQSASPNPASTTTVFGPEQDELVRAFQTAKEREADLSEQLRFAEEELRKMNRRVAEAQSDNNALSRQVERLSMHQARGESPRPTALQVKKELATSQSEVKRLETGKVVASGGTGSTPTDHETDEENAAKLKALNEELSRQQEAHKLTNKRISQLANEFLLLKVSHRDPDWVTKYNEAVELQKEAENQVNALKRKLTESTADLPSAVVARIEGRRPSIKSSESRAGMSKEWLLQKLDTYDKEVEELEVEMTVLRSTTGNLRTQVQRVSEEKVNLKSEVDQRERELRLHIEHLEKKDFVLNNLLELMVQRTQLLQEEHDVGSESGVEKPSQETNLNEQLSNLHQLLEKQREHSRMLEKQLNCGGFSIPRPMLGDNESMRLKEINALKTQLEEKDELLEDQESRIRELKSRVERAKKMNEVMKTLIDKEPTAQPPPMTLENRQTAIEMSGYRREIDSMRKEIAILQQKVTQIEKVREKLLLENKDLQEELKLREDSLFDQDDELEKRNADLAKAKRALELMQIELNEARKGLAAARAQEGMSTKISSTLAENERLRAELRRLEDELKASSERLVKANECETEAIEKCRLMEKELAVKEGTVQEKDKMIEEALKHSRMLDEELTCSRKVNVERIDAAKRLENTVQELEKKLQEKDSARAMVDFATGLPRSPASWRTDSSPDSGIGRDSSRDSRRGEMDRLRRECAVLRNERDEIAKEARRDKQVFERRLQELSNKLSSFAENNANLITANGSIGDLYARAVAEKQINTKIGLFNEHIVKQNSVISQLKIKNEIIQNKVLEYQRRYANLKEQYDAEQETWLSERVVLESKAKEQEERKNVIAGTRKSLQETSIRLVEAELSFEKDRQKFETDLSRLELEKSEMKVQLTQMKEHQKLPKVLQRFSASPSRSGHLSMINTGASATAANTETTRRLDSAEKTIVRLKNELQQRLEGQTNATISAVREAETARAVSEAQMEFLNKQLMQLNLFKEQAELFRERLIESEQWADREYKIWSEEREDLLCRIEDCRNSVEQWCIRLTNREGLEEIKADEIINDIVAEMERWRTIRQHMPVFQRRSHTSDTQSAMEESLNGTATALRQRYTQGHGHPPLSAGCQSNSVEWFSRSGNSGIMNLRGSTLSLAAGISPSLARSVTPSYARCGRSVSPDVAIRKITNYPDATPGFLVRSRQTSIDSLGSITDLVQRPFTIPGKPPQRQPISPARHKFFEDSAVDTGGSLPKPELLSSPPSSSSTAFPLSNVPPQPVGQKPSKSQSTSTPKAPKIVHTKKSAGSTTTASVLSRISSKLTGSKTDLSSSKGLMAEKRQSPLLSKTKQQSPEKALKSPEPPTKTSSIRSTSSTLSPASSAAPAPTTATGGSGSEVRQVLTSGTPNTPTKSADTATAKTARSSSLTGVGISPSIMALRQKFGGK